MKLLKVYIAPCGIGLGHVSRSAAIANELNKRGVDTLFSTYLDGIDYVRKMGFKLKEAKPLTFQVQMDGSVDFKRTSARSGFTVGVHRFLRQVAREIHNIGSYDPDVIFSDSRASTIIAAKLLRKPVILLLNQFRINIIGKPSEKLRITDTIFFIIANFFWIFTRTLIAGVWGLSDHILIPDYPMPYTISVKNLIIPKRYGKRVKLIGPIISTWPNELPDVLAIRKNLGLELQKPLVYSPISGPKIERLYLTKELFKILQFLPDHYQTILTRGDPNSNAKPTIKGNVVSYGWIDEVKQYKLLKTSDIIVSRAGHGIITKALAYGKPLILIPIPDQTEQNGNAFRAKRLGIAKVIAQKELNRGILQRSIDEIINSDEFLERSKELGRIALERDGVKVATDLIMKVGESAKR